MFSVRQNSCVFSLISDLSLCLSGDNKPLNSKAKISSQVLTASLPVCFNFRYRMCTQGELSIHTTVYFGDVEIVFASLWSTTWNTDSCSDWVTRSVVSPASNYNYSITVQGNVVGHPGQICIDDVNIYGGSCL